MGISLENIEPKDQIDPDLTCLLCDKISEKPKVCQSCPKVFCLPCFRIEVANNDNKCPNCKIHINYDNVSYLKSPPKEWFEKTNELTIKCEDCSEAILQYSNYEEHRINCQGRLSSIDEILAPVREAANEATRRFD
ncbi:Oidioi.mRNA.OKI2018_I69.chr1.g3413.t1.cds [Oikopleura dioica]|uniref:Oidioi.mRNA.OKI2018_I69.chr1.g3413.t1.cds n=1 Tax=Oikopleura dioica TaxID=34765 RepID=A0ABN7SXK3_OIKDI|nr:Oidioi.mRNA.OKI2018_I69.chr1.g3413.t1.cds [Oikopleura dioica]